MFKKLLVLSFVLSFGLEALASNYHWSTTGRKAHPLWKAIKGQAVSVPHRTAKVTEKKAGPIVCQKKVGPTKTRTTCKVPKDISAEESIAIYEKLRGEGKTVYPNRTYRTDDSLYKAVDRLFVFYDKDNADDLRYNESKTFYKSPCYKVSRHSHAIKCMQFWSVEIFKSYNAHNDAYTFPATTFERDQLEQALWIGKASESAKEKVLKAYDEGDFVSLVGEYGDEPDLLYVSLKKGINQIPVQFYNLWATEVGYYRSADVIKENAVDEEEYQTAVSELMFSIFLGSDAQDYLQIGEWFREGFDDVRSEALWELEESED